MSELLPTSDAPNVKRGAVPGAATNAAAEGMAPLRRKKKKGRTGLVVGIVAVLVFIAIVVVLLTKSSSGNAIAVETTRAASRTILQTVTATGVIDPETQVKISPEVSGEIVYLGAQEGAHVQKGQVLVRINPQQMLAERDEARAQIAAAQARMAQSRATLLRNQQDLARVQGLHEKKLSTNQELEAAQAQLKIADADLDAARYQVEQMQASYRRVMESVNKTTIVSPISGVVTKLNSKLGEKVVGAIQMTGTEIMTVADLSVIESVVNVSENDVVQVSMGDTAEVEVDAIPGQKFHAVVSRIANSPKQAGVGTQEQITNFEVRLRFVEPDLRFRPGMTATATIQTEKKQNILAVPIQSVTTRVDSAAERAKVKVEEGEAHNVALDKVKKEDVPKPVVFVRTGNVVHTRLVATGIRDDQYIEITSGLKPGDVVVSGSYRAITKDLSDGSTVIDAVKEKEVPKEKP
jgi:HlyD family secretion protein